MTINIREEGAFNVEIESVSELDSLLCKEIFISFKLEKVQPEQPRRKFKSLESLIKESTSQQSDEPVHYSITLSPGVEVIGRQRMYYTFSSLEDFTHNIENFISFIEDAYESPEQIKTRNQEFWDKIRPAEENLSDEDEAFNE